MTESSNRRQTGAAT